MQSESDFPFPSTSVNSYGQLAETLVQDRLKWLSDDYIVYRNMSVFYGNSRPVGEYDTIIVTPKGGVVSLEVKAGDIGTDEDGNLHREYEHSVKNISDQLAWQYHHILRRMKARFPTRPVPVRCFLVLPTGKAEISESFSSVDYAIIDSSKIGQLLTIIRDFNDQINPLQYNNVSRDEICAFIDGEVHVIPDISSISEALSVCQQKSNNGLCNWIPKIETAVPVIEVEAPAGAGKTSLAVTLLEKSVAEGKRAMYLGFHRNNVERLRKTAIASKINFIGTWYELARDKTDPLTDPKNLTPGEFSDWCRSLSEKLCAWLPESTILWDVIIVDGAEDFKTDWIVALANALTSNGHLYTLRDPLMQQRDVKPEFSENDHILIRTMETPLLTKCRVDELVAMELVPSNFRTTNPILGENTRIRFVKSKEDFVKATNDAVKEALLDGIKPEAMCVLTSHGLKSSDVLKRDTIGGLKVIKPTGEFNANNDQILTDGELKLDTVRRFKGLNAPCVIVTELDFEEMNDKVKTLLYLAMTRSFVRLELIITADSMNNLFSI